MIYLSGATNDRIEDRLIAAGVGLMVQPGTSQYLARTARYPDGFAADNGCFAQGESFDAERWMRWLGGVPLAGCHFAVAPDVVGNADATTVRSAPWLSGIRNLGFPAAYVVQNGAIPATVPWDSFDVMFIGGAPECRHCNLVPPPAERHKTCPRCRRPLTEWKESAAAARLVTEARLRDLWVHMGRVNTWSRLLYSAVIGCDSADGTMLAYGPDVLLPRLEGWLAALPTAVSAARAQLGLFDHTAA